MIPFFMFYNFAVRTCILESSFKSQAFYFGNESERNVLRECVLLV